jgi:3-oxoacyl-[acyl-carrier protein] reductase
VAATLEQFGSIDALVNSAGNAPQVRVDITEATEESFDELISINLKGPNFLTHAVARYRLTGKPTPRLPGGFKVIFITSASADTASVNRADCCISKAGLSMAAQL